MLKTLMIWIAAAGFSLSLYGQTSSWRCYTEARNIHDMAESNGWLYTASMAGIMKYHPLTGEKVFIDKCNSPLPGNWISVLSAGPDESLWIGTWTGGELIHLHNGNWTVYDSAVAPLPGCGITALDTDTDGNVWLGVSCLGKGLYSFNGEQWSQYTTTNSDIPFNDPSAILCKGNQVWIGSGGLGIAVFEDGNWTYFSPQNSGISTKAVLDIEADPEGNLWILHYDGLEKFDGTNFTLYDATQTNIQNTANYSMSIAPDGKIWTACISYYGNTYVLGGLQSFDGNTWIKYDTTNSGITTTNSGYVFAASDGKIYYSHGSTGMMGCRDGDVWTLTDASTSGLGHEYVRSIQTHPSGKVWTGTLDPEDGSPSLYGFLNNQWEGLPEYNNESWNMASDPEGILWIKNQEGVKYLNGEEWTEVPDAPPFHWSQPVPLYLNTLLASGQGQIWVDYLDRVETLFDTTTGMYQWVVHEGIGHYTGNGWNLYNSLNSGLPDASFYQIRKDPQGNIWVSAGVGLARFNGVWTFFPSGQAGLPDVYMEHFDIDTLGNFWFPDGNFGFYSYDGTQSLHFVHPDLHPYIGGGNILCENNGTVWQTTLFHLIRFDGTQWNTFSEDNSPLPFGNITALAVDMHGHKWIGTQMGLFVYREDGIILGTPAIPTTPETPVRAFPNPFTESFRIEVSVPCPDAEVELTDMAGQSLRCEIRNESRALEIHTGRLPAGIYLYRIVCNGQEQMSGKVVAY